MIELKNISAGYGKNTVLEGASAVFEKGRLTSIIGVNGCGKSTLLKAVLGILPLESGEIKIDGKSLSDMSRTDIARKVAYLAQGKNTPDMTVEQMVLHGRFPHLNYPRRYTKKDRETAFAAMEKTGVAELAEKPLSALSGGMRQNAYIAMALAQDTDYILLDEPTTYLDISHQFELMKTLGELAKSGKGVVTVMHDLPMAFDFSYSIAVANDKKIILQASPDEICKAPEITDVFGVKLALLPEENKYFYQYCGR